MAEGGAKAPGSAPNAPWAKGQSGNPAGKPKGVRNRATVILDALAEQGAAEVLKQVIEEAKAGDMRAAEILLTRIWPARKGRPVELDFPPIETAADIVKALGAVTDAVGRGDISPEEGQAVAAVLETKRRAIETVDLEARLTALETAAEAKGR